MGTFRLHGPSGALNQGVGLFDGGFYQFFGLDGATGKRSGGQDHAGFLDRIPKWFQIGTGYHISRISRSRRLLLDSNAARNTT
jgi:hypothetical protein